MLLLCSSFPPLFFNISSQSLAFRSKAVVKSPYFKSRGLHFHLVQNALLPAITAHFGDNSANSVFLHFWLLATLTLRKSPIYYDRVKIPDISEAPFRRLVYIYIRAKHTRTREASSLWENPIMHRVSSQLKPIRLLQLNNECIGGKATEFYPGEIWMWRKWL